MLKIQMCQCDSLMFCILLLGSLTVAGRLHAGGPVHCTAERQLQLPVDHQPTQQKQPD